MEIHPPVERENDRKERVFAFICGFKQAHDGLSPTMREIAAGASLGSSSVAAYYVDMLIGEGRLYVLANWAAGKSRGLGVTGGTWNLAMAGTRRGE